ncbi:hypothetical protein M011DRAFT_471486 [Sporormia fimetaria CBS 119925]|uniref:Acyl-coenzyme A thioesterase THEM4 n=1 Tax=Sporormia fimetaria CBS 119925 TaxID=1340428 RepID=A0A6A6V284_9PLEO|nr:hypothetical protein M011DRAFT_471486 [Sporormia fimetaria CBS 119925]
MSTPHNWTTYTAFLRTSRASESDLKYFALHPWLAPLLSPGSPYRSVPFFSRLEKGENNTLDRFFNRVINTNDTIPHAIALVPGDEWLALRRKELFASSTSSPSSSQQNVTGEEKEQATTEQETTQKAEYDFILLTSLAPSLSGFTDTAHGGLLSALFDEAMGCCTAAFRNDDDAVQELFTVNLNVTYRRPVPLPGVYAIRVRVEKTEGRKWWLKGELVGGDGVVRTSAESLWVAARKGGL